MAESRIFGLGGYGRGKPVNAAISTPAVGGLQAMNDSSGDVDYGLPFQTYNRWDDQSRIRQDGMRLVKVFPSFDTIHEWLIFQDCQIRVVYVENPNYLCVQSEIGRKWLIKHETKIHQSVLDGGDRLKMDHEVSYKGEPCAVFYKEMWRRGYVMRTNSNTAPSDAESYVADVMLVDWGDRGYVRLNQMRKLPSKWRQYAPMAFRVRLESNEIEAQEDRWPKKILRDFREMVYGKTLICQFVTKTEGADVILRGDHVECEFCKKRQCSINQRVERMIVDWKEKENRGDYSYSK